MKYGKSAGLVLAVGVCAGIATWGVWSHRNPHHEPWQHPASPAPQVATVRLAAPITGKPQPFAIDAATARAAVRDGELHVAMPDGTTQALRIERQYTDETGHWNLVGRARTRIGPQAMVLTFGANAVFGTLPMSDGHLLSVTTGPGGRVEIQQAGGLVPDGRTAAESVDVLAPPRPRSVPTATRVLTRADVVAAAAPPAPAVATLHSAAAARTAVQPALLVPDTTPVRIDVLAYYAPDLVALRGSAEAAETEIANMFAIANQAHIDSGSRVRLSVAHMEAIDVPATATNESLLNQMQQQGIPGVDIESARDTWAADLVTLVRPHPDADATCGISFLVGAGLQAAPTSATYGYSVVNVAPCSPVTLAHELGHNLGSNHDRQTATGYEGDLAQGAFMDSFGYRTSDFATIMAYPQGQPQVAYFSNPASTRCAGACGVVDYANNVRSLNLMAPAVAAFRGPQGTLSVGDAIVLEPTLGETLVAVPIRLSAPTDAFGVMVQVSITGGTATPGEDYAPVADPTWIVLRGGSRENWFTLRVLPDTQIEADETINVHVSTIGAPVDDADAVVTIANDDPRPRITGKLVFDRDVPVPVEPIDLTVMGLYDGDGVGTSYRLLPPDFAYDFPVRFGGRLTIDGLSAEEFVTQRKHYSEVVADTAFDLRVERGVVVGGRVLAPEGMAISSTDVPLLHVTDGVGNYKATHTLMVSPPDYRYRWRIPKHSDLFLGIDGFTGPGNANAFAQYEMSLWDVGADTNFDVQLSTLPTIRLCCRDLWRVQAPPAGSHAMMLASMYLSAPAPAGGVTVRYHLVDGTAKRGEDYVPGQGLDYAGTISIPEGQTFGILAGPDIAGDNKTELSEYFDVVVDEVVGAQMPVRSVRFWIAERFPRNGGGHQIMRAN
jgi:hypothetical protein